MVYQDRLWVAAVRGGGGTILVPRRGRFLYRGESSKPRRCRVIARELLVSIIAWAFVRKHLRHPHGVEGQYFVVPPILGVSVVLSGRTYCKDKRMRISRPREAKMLLFSQLITKRKPLKLIYEVSETTGDCKLIKIAGNINQITYEIMTGEAAPSSRHLVAQKMLV